MAYDYYIYMKVAEPKNRHIWITVKDSKVLANYGYIEAFKHPWVSHH